MVTLRPLGDRVLILPDQAPQMTQSGLHLAEHWKPEQTGTVIAVGLMTHPRKADAEELASHIEVGDHDHVGQEEPPCPRCEAAQFLRDVVAREPLVKAGDAVIFSWQVGQELFINDGEARYLLMHEADILAVVEGTPHE